jgi:glucose-6-phosphate 1-dehydrogenase
MDQSAQFDDLLTCRLGDGRKAVEPCSIIIFGASGDLTARKLVPALYHLCKEKQMPPAFRVIGFARREKTDASWRGELRSALDQFSHTKPVDDQVWQEFSQHVHYCQGDLTDVAAYQALEKQLASFGSEPLRRNLLFYLATSPSQFGSVVEQLHHAGLLHKGDGEGWQRVVIEKPFGHDLESACQLNQELTRYAH